MEGNKESLFSTGEFAKLCNTTKETLFHYDEIGILKPKLVKANGYRFYTAEQFFDYDIIRVLKRAGSSLREIKNYLEHYDTEHFLQILQEKKELLKEKRLQIEKMENMLENTIAMTKYALAGTYGKPQLIEEEEEYYLVVSLNPGEGDILEKAAFRLREHFLNCERCQQVDTFPIGSIILKKHVLCGSNEESYFFSKAQVRLENENLFIKPSGTYAVMLHKGGYDTLKAAYKVLLEYIKNEKLEIAGNAYVQDLVSYLASGTEANYVLRISVQVKGYCSLRSQ